MRDLASLPKAHLHLHLEAGMSPELLAELSAKYEREVPVIRGYGNFGVFADTYVAVHAPMRFGAEGWPGEIHLNAAGLEDPESYRPQGHVHFDEHLSWFDVKDDLPRRAGNS